MLPHNIKVNENNDNHRQHCCRVCDTTVEHDCCVAEMINLSKKGFNTMSAVVDKSTNTITHGSYGHLEPQDRINKSMEFRNIAMTHGDKDTKHKMVNLARGRRDDSR